MKHVTKTCPTCGQRIQQTKFTKLYGATLKELAKRFHRDPSTIWLWHKSGKLKKILVNDIYQKRRPFDPD